MLASPMAPSAPVASRALGRASLFTAWESRARERLKSALATSAQHALRRAQLVPNAGIAISVFEQTTAGEGQSVPVCDCGQRSWIAQCTQPLQGGALDATVA